MTKTTSDNYPPRIYITFKYNPDQLGFFDKAKYEAAKLFYGQYPPLAAINYIWESTTPKGTIVPNPYAEQVKMIVVESGRVLINRWAHEECNVYDDYRKALGGAPA